MLTYWKNFNHAILLMFVFVAISVSLSAQKREIFEEHLWTMLAISQ